MKRLKVRTVEQQIKEGKIECITDIKLGYVEIRRCATGVRETIKVIRNKYQKKVVSEVINAYLYKKERDMENGFIITARRAKAHLKELVKGTRADGMGTFTSKIYAKQMDGTVYRLTNPDDVDQFAKGTEFIITD